MILIESHIVPQSTLPQRVYDYALGLFYNIPTRKGLKKAIEKGCVLVNGAIIGTGKFVVPGDEIALYQPDNPIRIAYNLNVNVLFEDNYLAIIYKPSGIVVSGNRFRTVQNALLNNIVVSSEPDALQNPLPAHRIDSGTCGLLLVAKTQRALITLNEYFKLGVIQKKYKAIVIGKIPESGFINDAISEKESLTLFKRLKFVNSLKNNYLSLVELYPKTGRTHQLRIHLSKLGFPIFGDKEYGIEGMVFKGKGMFLSAVSLTFPHPITHNEVNIEVEEPHKFVSLLTREQRRFEKYNHCL